MDDQIGEYELACLLEDIERTVRNENAENARTKVRTMFDRARMNGVIRYPQPGGPQ
jgi:hypothetical protein